MNMRYFISVLFFLILCAFSVFSQKSEMYRLLLNDKGNPPYSINKPYEFLSQKAIDRRHQQGLLLDESDLPIDPHYFQEIKATGAKIQTYSKWAETIVVIISDPEIKSILATLPFVKGMTKVWEGDLSLWKQEEIACSEMHKQDSFALLNEPFFSKGDYGKGLTQIELNHALPLHEQGYTGKGMMIAVMDGGFKNVDLLDDVFNPGQILGVKNFSHHLICPFRINESHGTRVLSCILSDKQGELIGTAPDAQFYLMNTEIGSEEYPVEEDYWMAAVEYADSIGVDIITTSLGYSTFNDPTMNHTWDELDGYTVPASRMASMIAGKGMVLFISAGNSGNIQWQKSSVPADAKNILTVGALTKDSLVASFSSWGAIADGRIKPDVMAMGVGVATYDEFQQIVSSNGTSFATPLLAGMGACLWQAYPHLTSFELMDLIRLSSNKYYSPDEHSGYGIPDLYKAYLMGNSTDLYLDGTVDSRQEVFYIDYPNNRLCLVSASYRERMQPLLRIYTADGRLIVKQTLMTDSFNLDFLNRGLYIVAVQTEDFQCVRKFIKQ